MRVALVDDDRMALQISESIISAFFKDNGMDCEIDSFVNPLAFMSSFNDNQYSLVILDIDMPELNGIQIAQEIRKKDYELYIIFLSQKESLVFEVFSVHPLGFIRKSRLIEDFAKVMKLFLENADSNSENDDFLVIVNKKETTSIRIRDIVYIEGNKNYQNMNLRSGEIVKIRILMSSLEKKLEAKKFIRIHKGFLVNSAFIAEIKKDCVVLNSKKELPISPKRKDEIADKFMELTRDRGTLIID